MEKMLLQPLKVGEFNLPNRVIIQPMEGCDGELNGAISDLTRRRYLRFARSGVSIIWFEATSVCPEGRSNPRQLYLCEETKESYRVLIQDMKKECKNLYGYEPVIVVQLNHSGRQSRPVDKPRAIMGSHNEYLNKMKPVTEDAVYATEEYLDSLPDLFVKAAKLAVEVGFDAIDVKNCHGYLFNEMMGAYMRDDKYGGESIDNRARLHLDSFKKVMDAVGDKVMVTTRFGAYDNFPEKFGFGKEDENGEPDLTEAYYVIDKLVKMGLKMINITIGNPYVNPHVNRPYKVASPEKGEIGVARIHKITRAIQQHFKDLVVISSGMTYDAVNAMDEAEKMLEDGSTTLAGFGRMAFAYPDFLQDYIKTGKLDPKKVCLTCGNCTKMMRAGGVAGCPVRDTAFYMPIFKEVMAKK